MIIVMHINLWHSQTQEQQQLQITEKKIFKNSTLFTDCISEIDSTQVHNAKDIDIIMAMYNLMEYGNHYSENLEVDGDTIEMKHL